MRSAGFRFNCKGAHLTYRTHINLEGLHDHIVAIGGQLRWFSGVHETSHGETPYDHSHFAFEFMRKVDINAERRFDFEGIHPNIQKWTGMKHYYNG